MLPWCNVCYCCGNISSLFIIAYSSLLQNEWRALENGRCAGRSSHAACFILTGFRHFQFCSYKFCFLDTAWLAWCFAVALNFQSLGLPMDLNDGRFQDNGGCGYVLKPAVLMSSQRSFDPGSNQHNVKPTHLLLKVHLWSTERWIIHCGWIYGLWCNVTGLCVCALCPYMCVSMPSNLGHCEVELILTLPLQINAFLPDAVNQQWCKTPAECLSLIRLSPSESKGKGERGAI